MGTHPIFESDFDCLTEGKKCPILISTFVTMLATRVNSDTSSSNSNSVHGKMRYANNSNYKNDTMIRKEAYVNRCVLSELKRIIEDSEILKEDDNLWPRPDRVGRQELEVVLGEDHISF